MKKKYTKKEVLNKIVEKLNEKGFKKDSLYEVEKEELKPILKEIYNECKSLGGLDNSPLENWSQACKEVMAEKEEKKEEIKENIKEDNYKSIDKEENKRDILKREDYDDDLIQLEFPKVYIDKIHGPRIEKLSEQLEKQRNEERRIKDDFDKTLANELRIFRERQEKSQQQQFNIGDEKKKLDKKRRDFKNQMKQKIKNNSHMTNNEFLMLLHLMRLKKEAMYESNPYIVDFSVTLESVYQSENAEDDGDDNNTLFSRFESDLNKYVG
jgi:hypothetical protein